MCSGNGDIYLDHYYHLNNHLNNYNNHDIDVNHDDDAARLNRLC